MESMKNALDELNKLGSLHGKVLPLRLIFQDFIDHRICSSKESIVECLRGLQKDHKIRPINFGVDIELLGEIEQAAMEHVQSSLNGFAARKSA